MTASTTITALGPLDQLDASLDDFAPSIGNNNQSSNRRLPFGYPSTHSGFRSDDLSETGDSDSEASAGGYSPPAWRRLGNGDRSSGFWRKGDDLAAMMYDGDEDDDGFGGPRSRESSPEYESADEVLAQAIRTRLPTGSLSPEKERSPEPEFHPAQQHLIDEVVHIKREHDGELALGELKDGRLAPKDMSDNCRSDLVTPHLYCFTVWLIPYQLFALPSGQKSSSEPSRSSRPSTSSARGSAS